MSGATLDNRSTVVIGAGPAGLTAAYLLSKEKVPVTVLEADRRYVGGIARTVDYKGYLFDIGGHRFFSKSQEVEDLWTELLPNDMLVRPRSSRIYYGKNFYSYPLKPIETLLKLGFIQTALCLLSYAKVRLKPIKAPKNFEEWVTNEFGERLYRIFFKTYTEKVWGMRCQEISADWAAQRIKGLSLTTAILNAIRGKPSAGKRTDVIKTLIDSFRYPRRGPGMMWEACARRVRSQGGSVQMGCEVTACSYDAARALWEVSYTDAEGRTQSIEAGHVISSAPMRQLINGLSPRPSAPTLTAANALKYRDFLTVVLILKDEEGFADNWIYIHDPGVRVGRIQNFRSWSPEMVPVSGTVCYGLEYFCFEGDGLWNSTDEELLQLGASELAHIGLGHPKDVLDGCVVRQRKAYPVYEDGYASNVETIRRELRSAYPNLHLVGRNGMHKYNNQDHAMMTAMLCVRNIVAGRQVYDLWQVNQDAEYHEGGTAGEVKSFGLRTVPARAR
jgi:protoporphyrinogen oxidase